MSISLGILFGIIAMFSWGIGDFFVAKAVRNVGVFRTFFWSTVLGLVPFLIIFALFFKFSAVSLFTGLLLIAISSLFFVGVLSLYKGFKIGVISIISPIASAGAVVTVILSLIFLKEVLSAPQAIGVSLAILGSILASFKFHGLIKLKLKKLATGVEFAVIAMLTGGVAFVLLDITISELGWFMPLFFIRIIGFFLAMIYAGAAKKNISFPINIWWILLVIIILEAIAMLSIGAGISSDLTAIVVPVSSAFPAITIILARIFFKEILELNQKIGVVSIMVGLVLLSV